MMAFPLLILRFRNLLTYWDICNGMWPIISSSLDTVLGCLASVIKFLDSGLTTATALPSFRFRVLLLHVVTFCLVLCFDWPRNILLSPHELINHRVLVRFSHIMYSYMMHVCFNRVFLEVLEMKNCVKCSLQTDILCKTRAKPLCNKPKECSVPADEDSLGWKAGVLVAFCVSCPEVPIPNARTKQAIVPVKDSKPVIKKCTAKKQPAPSQSDGCQRKCL